MSREMTGEELSRYVPVHERLQEFWTKHPKGRVISVVQEVTADRVRLRAEVYREGDEHPFATGHAEEIRVGDINEFAAIENCETSAVGRALAMAGFKIDRGMASQQEVQKVQRQRRQKAGTPAAAQQAPEAPANTLTSEEVDALAKDLKSTSVDAAAIKLKLLQMGVGNTRSLKPALAQLTPEQGMELLAFARGELNQSEGQAPSENEGNPDVA